MLIIKWFWNILAIYIYVFWYSIWQTFWHFPAIQESFWHSTLHDIYSDPPFSHSNLNLIWNSILSMLNLIWRIFWGILLHYILYNIICPDMLSDILYSICSLILIWQFIWQSTWHIWHMYSFCLNLFDMYSDVPIWHDIWHSVLAGPARKLVRRRTRRGGREEEQGIIKSRV